MSDVQYYAMPAGHQIAYRHAAGASPTLVFLPGYMSDMDGGKATALFEWARARGQACLLLDYSGCGRSDGTFAEGTLSKWRGEVRELIRTKVDGPVILVGSSMGGWLNLMVGMTLGQQLAGLIGVASAPDFTEWGRSDADKCRLAAGETVLDDNPYGPEPTPMHPGFWADGQANLLLGGNIPIMCPVRLLHGQNDADVPWDISMRLADALQSKDVVVTLVKDGDHRLSREQDIARLLAIVEELL
ncbi:alpha/beta hydrolase [Erythrobacter sp. SDW2]|uniref:alpha/beta hydrolase n=1 Tax=Erythrobacter sp. SDW2 TaxID=2907154 RepID=UPI001F1CD615|nr:alpha/beta hydrolase [Erythrobacter sp. SDW2]UIP07203.1 alpha/beta hydrolase [Erythrobacter sp. SDW2]